MEIDNLLHSTFLKIKKDNTVLKKKLFLIYILSFIGVIILNTLVILYLNPYFLIISIPLSIGFFITYSKKNLKPDLGLEDNESELKNIVNTSINSRIKSLNERFEEINKEKKKIKQERENIEDKSKNLDNFKHLYYSLFTTHELIANIFIKFKIKLDNIILSEYLTE